MSLTAAVLTPPGSAAIAVVAVQGPRNRDLLRRLFTRASDRPIPEGKCGPYFGRFGDAVSVDETVVIGTETGWEVHLHGGRRVVEWALQLLADGGCIIRRWEDLAAGSINDEAMRLLPQATTLRTARIILDQFHGAYERAIRRIESDESDRRPWIEELVRNVPLGRHLVDPWRVVLAGKPNAGKSSLMNAIAGYTRSVVSPTAGTTRDALRLCTAIDGWPVDLIDTAGIRLTEDPLESSGVEAARRTVDSADLIVWLHDLTDGEMPTESAVAAEQGVAVHRLMVVGNKADAVPISDRPSRTARYLSATRQEGIDALLQAISRRLVADPPSPGAPVPFLPEHWNRWQCPPDEHAPA